MSTTQLINNKAGVKTKSWGPHFWKTMYFAAMNYPLSPTQQDRKHYKMFYMSLQYILPCCWCLESYHRFLADAPIEDYLDSRMKLLKWIWIIHDKVNKKLIIHEKEKYMEEENRLLDMYNGKKLSKRQLEQRLDRVKQRICTTSKSKPFKEVLDEYAQHRACQH